MVLLDYGIYSFKLQLQSHSKILLILTKVMYVALHNIFM